MIYFEFEDPIWRDRKRERDTLNILEFLLNSHNCDPPTVNREWIPLIMPNINSNEVLIIINWG